MQVKRLTQSVISSSLVALARKCHVALSQYVITYMYSLQIDKDLCGSRNVSVEFLCALLVYLSFSSGELFSVWAIISPFLLLSLCYPYFGTFPSHVVSKYTSVGD
jgi:hypothetical protein